MNDIEKTKDAIIEMTMSEYIGECLCADSQEIILQVLEKQIPYKPINDYCKCGALFLDHLTNYCGNCGQRLDWSGEDE